MNRLRNFSNAVRLLRPRKIAESDKLLVQTKRSVDRLAEEIGELKRAVKIGRERADARTLELERQIEKLRESHLEHVEVVERQLTAIRRDASEQQMREAQLRAILERDIELERDLAEVPRLLDDPAVAEHVRSRIAEAPLHLHPFPHIVVDNLFPDSMYDAVLKGIPPPELFADRPVNKRYLNVPFTLAPVYGRRVWSHLALVLAPRVIKPAVCEKFKEPLQHWLASTLAVTDPAEFDRVAISCSQGRIMLRSAGYVIPPHRDPKWGFITCLLYLTRPTDDHTMGTQLYSVDDDDEAIGALPHWIAPERCHFVADVENRPNRALIFLNSSGAHGARIPEDAPPTLERYIYQFRIGPRSDQIRALLDRLPPERQLAWSGKISDY